MESKLLLTSALVFAAASAQASIAYNDPAGQGTQAFPGNLALEFTVNAAVSVTAMGVFNSSGTGTIGGPITVAIFNTSTNTEVAGTQTTFSDNIYSFCPGSLGFDVCQAIAPVVLAPGTYEVDAAGFNSFDLNGNLALGSTGPLLDGSGLLTFTGAAWDNNLALDDPATCPGCAPPPVPQNVQFDAGTFEFTAAAVPEPGTLALMGLGLAGLAAGRRFRKAQ